MSVRPWTRTRLLPWFAAVLLVGCGVADPLMHNDCRGCRPERVAALASAACWAPAFGGVEVGDLVDFDMVVVDGVPSRDGADVTAEDVARLHDAEVLVLGYLSVGTVEDWRHYAPQVSRKWTLGPVDDWPGEQYADARKAGWRDLMVSEARALAAAGFDGLYLDNLDVAEVHPDTADAVVHLVQALHGAVPELLLVAQNGLTVAERLPIDAIGHEDVFWRWDDGYRPSTSKETRRIVAGLRRLHARGLPVFTLDYTEPGAPGAADALRRSLSEGFRPAVSVLSLDHPPHATGPCGRAT